MGHVQRASTLTDSEIIDFLCRLIRGESPEWPAPEDADFPSRFLDLAAYHGVDALACYRVQDHADPLRIPTAVGDELTRRLKRAVAIEMVRANDLATVRERLAEAGIPVILIKGGALAYTVYPEPYLRARVDTDLFIAIRDIDGIRDILRASGYRLEGWVYKSHQFKALRSGFGGQMVKYDIHWRSSNHAKFARVLDFEEAWRESVHITQLGNFRTLSPRHALLQACLHRAGNPRHDPDRLVWLYDVHLLLAHMSEADQAGFARLAVINDVQALCAEPIEKCGRLFRTENARSVLERLRAPVRAGSLRRRFRESQLGLMVDDLMKMGSGKTRMDYLKEFLLPPRAYLLEHYGKTSGFWLPVLYFRYILGGFFEKILLR